MSQIAPKLSSSEPAPSDTAATSPSTWKRRCVLRTRSSSTASQPPSAISASAIANMAIQPIGLRRRAFGSCESWSLSQPTHLLNQRISDQFISPYFWTKTYGAMPASRAAERGTVSASPPVHALNAYHEGFASRETVSRPAESQNWQAPYWSTHENHQAPPMRQRRRFAVSISKARSSSRACPSQPRSQRDSKLSDPQPSSVT